MVSTPFTNQLSALVGLKAGLDSVLGRKNETTDIQPTANHPTALSA
jgi:hypothetical protein